MNPLLQKKLATFDFRMVGEVVQSPINLESLTKGCWIALDGRDCNRSDYPELALWFPGGVFASTIRTLNANPNSAAIAADGTNFLMSGVAGTSPLQASADGVSWSTSATWAASTASASIIVAGSRYVMAGSGGDLVVPFVSNTGQTAANQVAKANWTATTVATTTTLQQGLAYGSTANGGAGRTVMIPNAAGTTIWTLDDGATAWVARAHANSRTKKCVIWTGRKFIIPCTDPGNILLVSSDGVTWVEQISPIPFGGATFVASGLIASNGNGIVVLSMINVPATWFMVSLDHGVSWRKVSPTPSNHMDVYTGLSGALQQKLSFANGKFITLPSNLQQNSLISADGVSWQEEPLISGRGLNPATANPDAIAYKAGVYLGAQTGSTVAQTYTEDMSQFKLPTTATVQGSNVNYTDTGALYQEYIKARSN